MTKEFSLINSLVSSLSKKDFDRCLQVEKALNKSVDKLGFDNLLEEQGDKKVHFVRALNQMVATQFHAIETLYDVFSPPKYTEAQRNAISDEILPKWLATPLGVKTELLPAAQKYGIAETHEEMRDLLGMSKSTDETISLFSYVRVVWNRVKDDLSGLQGYELEKALLEPKITNKEHAVIGMLLLQTVCRMSKIKSGIERPEVLLPALFIQLPKKDRKILNSELPKLCNDGMSFAQKRKEANRMRQYIEVLQAFSKDTFEILGDPDDSRHDILRDLFKQYESNDYDLFRDMIYFLIVSDDLGDKNSSSERIRNLMQTAEDLDDQWYNTIAQDILAKVRKSFPYRLYYMKELEDMFDRIPTVNGESVLTLQRNIEFIENHEMDFRASSTYVPASGNYIHTLSDDSMRRWDMDPNITRFTIMNVEYPPGEYYALWFLKLVYKAPDAKIATEATLLIANDELGMYVWTDMVDKQAVPNSALERHAISLLSEGVKDAIQNAPDPLEPKDEPLVNKPALILQSSSSKGRQPFDQKDTKRKTNGIPKSAVILEDHNSIKIERHPIFELQINRNLIKEKGEAGMFYRAIDRYSKGLRRMKMLLSNVSGPKGGNIYELRAKNYRMLFERVNSNSLELIDIVLRKDLDTWINNH